jgi:hypothetical protein
MTLVKGDHVVIKRDGKILTEENEAYHEFEVVLEPYWAQVSSEGKAIYVVILKVVK